MKIIDLLNLVYEKKAPKKILYKYCEYEFDEFFSDYKNKDGLWLFQYLFKNEDCALWKEVEIIEDKPKKIKKLNFNKDWKHGLCLTYQYRLVDTLNEVIDTLNTLVEKSDKL